MIYDCCARQKKCRSILKHVLKRCDNRKSCRRPVVSLSHATKIVPSKSALKCLLAVTFDVYMSFVTISDKSLQVTKLIWLRIHI